MKANLFQFVAVIVTMKRNLVMVLDIKYSVFNTRGHSQFTHSSPGAPQYTPQSPHPPSRTDQTHSDCSYGA